MRKFNYTFLFLFLGLQLSAQKHSGNITYKIANIDFEDKGKNVDITGMLAMARLQVFTLDFNKNHSSFHLKNFMDNEKENGFYNELAKVYISASDYYFDYQKKILLEEMPDGTLLESKMPKLPWHITSETKIIDQYQCYKATYTFDYLARDQKLKTRVIIAWFAPSLPYSYGPKNYNGLPGLILELTESSVTFLVSKIELLTEEIEIKFPKGKSILKDEFEKAILKH